MKQKKNQGSQSTARPEQQFVELYESKEEWLFIEKGAPLIQISDHVTTPSTSSQDSAISLHSQYSLVDSTFDSETTSQLSSLLKDGLDDVAKIKHQRFSINNSQVPNLRQNIQKIINEAHDADESTTSEQQPSSRHEKSEVTVVNFLMMAGSDDGSWDEWDEQQ